jgi:hypothetical protein
MHRRRGCCSCARLDTGYAPQTAAFLSAVEVEKSGQEACNGLKMVPRFHAPTSRGVPALQRLRMHDKAVESSQSRGGLNDCDDLVRAGQGSGVARFRLPTPPAQGDDEWGISTPSMQFAHDSKRRPSWRGLFAVLLAPRVRHGGRDSRRTKLLCEGFGQEPTRDDEGAQCRNTQQSAHTHAARSDGDNDRPGAA